jgi:hypothetical protein
MKLQCGYIPGTQSMCYHPIKNIKFWGSAWSTCTVSLNGKILKVIVNENVPVTIIQKYKDGAYLNLIELTINEESIYDQKYLYHVDLEFEGIPEYELLDNMIVDH